HVRGATDQVLEGGGVTRPASGGWNVVQGAKDEPAVDDAGGSGLNRGVGDSGVRHASGCYLAMAWPAWTGIELQLEHVSTEGLL
ncbi:hypothetical protein C3E98_036275, partial [Pseudomonas sp. MWU13-2625]